MWNLEIVENNFQYDTCPECQGNPYDIPYCKTCNHLGLIKISTVKPKLKIQTLESII